MDKKKYPHADHRQRVRKAFREADTATVPDRSLLELLLFYSIPRRDTNALAGALLEKFGSLKAVLDAPYDELIKVDGMGESSALLLSVLPEISLRYREDGKPLPALFETGEAEKFVSALFRNCKNEEFHIICIDALGRATVCKKAAEGDENSVSVSKRAILEAAFSSDAESVILAHNHPDGDAAPSKEDIELTREAARLLGETGIRLTDHLISGRDGILSLASTAKYKSLFE